MPSTDDLMSDGEDEALHPLGRPTNRPTPEEPEGRWLPVAGSPHIERNTVTGRMRNTRPAPTGA